MFLDAYGEKPNCIKIVFMSDNIEDVCPYFYELRDASGKVYAYGDGCDFSVAMQRPKGIEYVKFTEAQIIEKKGSIEQFMEEAAQNAKGEWKQRLTLRFVVIGVKITGYFEITTFGKDSSIPSIVGEIDRIIEKTGGRLKEIPFDLIVEKHKSDKANDKRQYPVLKLICNYSPDDIREVAALPTSSYYGILTAEKLKEIKAGNIENQTEDIEAEEI